MNESGHVLQGCATMSKVMIVFHMQGIIIRALVTTDVKQTLGQGMVHNFAICTSYA